MTNVLLINTPLFKLRSQVHNEDTLPPIGLGYIATALQARLVNVELIDAVAQNISLQELISIINDKRPQHICLNIFSTNYEIVKSLVEAIKFDVHFIIGGLSTGSLFRHICEWKTGNTIDILFGDGELIIDDMIKETVRELPIYEKKYPLRRVYKVSFDSKYFPRDISALPLDRRFLENEPYKHHLGFTEAYLITSRGCNNNCAFCSAARSLNHDFPIRERSALSIIEELNYLLSIYPHVESIRILDDLFLKNSKSLNKGIKIFKGFSLNWRAMAHIATFREVQFDVLRNLNRSGCTELFIGLESGSASILKRINKVHDVSLIKKTVGNLFRAGINVKGYFIFGFPGETEKDFQMTYELAYTLKELSIKNNVMFRPSVFQFRPYHGTKIYNELVKRPGNANDSALHAIEPNEALSALVGRAQFNFHSGNFSSTDFETLYKYILLTARLNSTEADLSPSQLPANIMNSQMINLESSLTI